LTVSGWHEPSIISAVVFAGLCAVHLIDDFLAGVPQEFNLTIPVAGLLALAYMIALIGLIAAAASRSRSGYLGLAIAGFLIAFAQLAKSLPEILMPGPWRLGLPSESIAIALAISAALAAVTSLLAWRETGPA
jgi:hypothetical protein